MSKSQQSKSSARQSADRTTSKHDVNLRKNTVVYFQVGLIVALLLSIFLFELKSPVAQYEPEEYADVPIFTAEVWNEPIRRETPKEPQVQQQEVSDVLPPEPVPDFIDLEPQIFKTAEPSSDTFETIDVGSFEDIPDDPVEPTSFVRVEQVPIFPGCEGLRTNEERKICMQQKMNKFINRNFDTGLGSRYGLSGLNKVDVQFTIDEFGKVIDIKTRAPHPALEEEAVRVISKLPQMQPGKQRDRKVRVFYIQPIRFQVQD